MYIVRVHFTKKKKKSRLFHLRFDNCNSGSWVLEDNKSLQISTNSSKFKMNSTLHIKTQLGISFSSSFSYPKPYLC